MKMRCDDYTRLRDSIKSTYSPGCAGRSDERIRWDCLWNSGFDITPLYSYLNDSHIDTALRAIMRDVTVTSPLPRII